MIRFTSLLALMMLTFVGIAARPYLMPPVARQGMLDLLLVMDTTASMDPALESLKRSAPAMTQRLQQRYPGVRLGLVAFRDHGDSYLTRRCPLTTAPGFLNCIARLDSDGGGNGTEAVLAGLQAAAASSDWRSDAADQVVVLIGDAASHASNREAIDRLVISERARGRVFHTLQLGQHKKTGEQWRRIAHLGGGSFYQFSPEHAELGSLITGL